MVTEYRGPEQLGQYDHEAGFICNAPAADLLCQSLAVWRVALLQCCTVAVLHCCSVALLSPLQGLCRAVEKAARPLSRGHA